MEFKIYSDFFEKEADAKISWLESELSKIRSGRANLKILDDVKAEYYGELTPLIEMANLSIPEPREILIKPYEKSQVNPIQSALLKANLNLTPVVDGDKIRIKLPQLTEENRKENVKKAKAIGEKAKQEVRFVRRDTLNKLKSDKIADKDLNKFFEGEIEKITKKYIDQIDAILTKKEKDLLSL
ncbi:ribosome recycling factor [Mycoplasma bradburyae]|uniref:Ribosome-recycling factor n=1 Tax=Mycoplasma bradburyae TaxID=2963128 RepID=A0AAW6HPK9_9MOLU|nr:ribosome recycling factor [Mycoplasma bradburyae]MDC4163129.1 ribosome recycling factor [Mycoplasma bradburyae]MDC4181738.1 ribosome recycling factor [Mycoplasma bradburyae]MDC4182445.1 ribosome recycling factor [Mycoplasma bradburyae]MDC4183664.1 ribosome recycling factor [Mycoplasma bradburyae]MDC4183911.1 ribosome recycling factor [Mycoplasma bradburyae]